MAAAIGAAISVGATLAGSAIQMNAMQKQTAALKDAERLREKQMTLQAQRERREAIRQASVARATALAATTNQGASAPGSSALGGAYGQIEGQKNRQTLAINQNLAIGQGIFAANNRYSSASLQAGIGEGIAGMGQATGNFITKGANSGWKFTA